MNLLEYSSEFVALAKTLNFSATARTLNLSASGLTRHIASLEQDLGFDLFVRTPALRLTEAGGYYLTSVETVLEGFGNVVEKGRGIARLERDQIVVDGEFNVGLDPSTDIVYEACGRFHADHPALPKPRILTGEPGPTATAVVSGKADVGMLYGTPDELPDGFACLDLLAMPTHVLVRADSPLVPQSPIAAETLGGYRLVNAPGRWNAAFFEGERRALAPYGVSPDVSVKDCTNCLDLYLTMEPDEFALCGCSDGRTHVGDIVAVGFRDPVPCVTSVLVYNERSEKPCVAEFVETCRRLARER